MTDAEWVALLGELPAPALALLEMLLSLVVEALSQGAQSQ